MRIRRVPLAAILVLSVAVVSCSGAGAATPNTLAFTVTESGFSGLPDEIEAGIYKITVTNESGAEADVDLIERGDVDLDQFLSDFEPVLEGGPIPAYAEQAVGIGFMLDGETRTTTAAIPPGNFVVFNTFPEVPTATMLGVTGETPDIDDLPSGATIVAEDYGFSVSGIESGTNTITFINDGPEQIHHAVIMGFEPGVDEAEAEEIIQAFFNAPEDEEPDLPEPEDVGSSGVYSPGSAGTFELTLEEGRTYGVFCFIHDRTGGPPHAFAYDMYEFFTVSG